MMGQHRGNQDRLFYSFNLDEHVPSNHLLRGIDRFLDLGDLRQHILLSNLNLAALSANKHGVIRNTRTTLLKTIQQPSNHVLRGIRASLVSQRTDKPTTIGQP